jgi:hypothetical protein
MVTPHLEVIQSYLRVNGGKVIVTYIKSYIGPLWMLMRKGKVSQS